MNGKFPGVDVFLWGTCIGRLKWDSERQLSVFQFTDEYFSEPYDVCPLTHGKQTAISSFYGNKGDLYQGLPEFLADSLPDRWGSTLFNK